MFIKHFVVLLTAAVLGITFLPNIVPNVKISKSIIVEQKKVSEKCTPNTKLTNLEIFDNIIGPESFASDKNFLYTSLHTGEVVKFVGDELIPVVKFGGTCSQVYDEGICGRPLGIRFGNDGYLYVADAYYGIFKANVTSGQKVCIVPFGAEIEKRKVTFPNSVAISCDNEHIYWTDSSTDFKLLDGLYILNTDGSGRLIHTNIKTGKNEVLIDKIIFANGVFISHKEDFILVSDLFQKRILRYYLKGEKKGSTDFFMINLPGIIDNIQSDGKNGYLISLFGESHLDFKNIYHTLAGYPNLRRFMFRTMRLVELLIEFIDENFPNSITKRSIHWLGHLKPALYFNKAKSIVVHVSESGDIIDCLWTDDKYHQFSEAFIHKDHLYLGSPINQFLARIRLSKIGWTHLQHTTDSLSAKKKKCKNLKIQE